MKSIGERIEYLRKEKEDLTRIEFGKLIGKNEQGVYNLERGRAKVTDEMVDLICDKFNISKEWLLNGQGQVYSVSEETLDKFDLFQKVKDCDKEDVREIIENLLELNDKQINVIKQLVDLLAKSEHIK